MSDKVTVVVIGCGNMGSSHARAYFKNDGFRIVGLVDKLVEKRAALAAEVGNPLQFDNLAAALKATRPAAVSVCTYPDTHARFALAALAAGAHVFVEKPIAETVEQARRIAALARRLRKKVVVGYILRHHPAWMKFIELARALGKPLVMRMNLNQQSSGKEWGVHKHLLESMSPIVDCGVHYVDVMCQMTGAKPVRVHCIGARLSGQIKKSMYNYGQLQVVFDDGSVGWYEAGWGPMMSEVAFFVKDVVGPKGCVSIVKSAAGDEDTGSADLDSHTKTNSLRLHHAELGADGRYVRPDEVISTADEPGHQELCDREQAYFLKAIREDLDLSDHVSDAINSLRIVLAADKSFRTARAVRL
jgi:predicted dehydrogenase